MRQPPHPTEEGERPGNPVLPVDSRDENQQEHIIITHIIATDVATGFRRLPAGFYVAVSIDGRARKTPNKPAFVGDDTVEWDEEIFLPLERPSVIYFKVYASFELGTMLGKGELLREFRMTVGELLNHHEQLQPIRFPAHMDGEAEYSCSSLRIVIERRVCDANEARADFYPSESDDLDQLGQLTDAGHLALQRYRHLDNPQDLDQAIAYFERVQNICPLDHPSRATSLFNLANAKFIHSQVDNAELELDVSIALYQDSLQLRPSSHPDHTATLLDLGFALLSRFQRRGNEADVAEGKDLLVRILEISPANSYTFRAARDVLQAAEYPRSVQAAEPTISDLEMIQRIRADLPHISDSDPRRFALLGYLGIVLYSQFQHFGNLADIHESVLAIEEAVQLTPDDHPDKPISLNNLGLSLHSRFARLGDLGDLDKSISMQTEAVQLTPDDHPHKPTWLSNLGVSLQSRFEHLGHLGDLDRSILIKQEAVQLTPNGHPAKPAWLDNLGISLQSRFEHLGQLGDLDKSISMKEEAVQLTPDGHPDKPARLNNLGVSLQSRFDRLGDLGDLNRSISIKQEAVQLTPNDHPAKPARLDNLGISLQARFDRLGSLGDIDRSISMKEEAVQLTPNGHPDKPTRLNNLGFSLRSRFEHLGHLGDVDRSVLMQEEAVQITPDGHPAKPARLSNLGISLQSRFDRLGDLGDLDRSISTAEEAVQLTPDGHPAKPTRLSYLGISLQCRFDRLGSIGDLDKSISIREDAVQLTPHSHPDKPAWLNNLGISLQARFDRLGSLSDLDRSISMKEEAVQLTPDGHPYKPTWLNNLGVSLLSRFDYLGHPGDLDRSISIAELAAQLTPDGHPHKPGHLLNLGNSFLVQFKHSHNPSSLVSAVSHFSDAARTSTGPPSVRLQASVSWISCARLQHNSQSVLNAHTVSVNLLQELAWIGLPLKERHRLLLEAADIARDAASAALAVHRPETAVELLEQGRSIVWSQLLQLRTPVDELRVKHPALADQFQQVSQALEQASSRENPTSNWLVDDSDTQPSSLEKEAQKHRQLALTREKLLADIRLLPGFERFLLPQTVQQLAASAHSGPVVFLNASTHRCDALIVKSIVGDVIHVPLSGVNFAAVVAMQKRLSWSLTQKGRILQTSGLIPLEDSEDLPLRNQDVLMDDDIVRLGRPAGLLRSPEEVITSILERLWKDVVYPVLEALPDLFLNQSSVGEKMPRIFWCPTGPFAFLPIHAAGLYTAADPGVKLSDFVISSYTPTLGALTPSQKESDTSLPNIHLLAVPQPDSDGQARLKFVATEIDHLRTLSAMSPFVTFQEGHGIVEDVLDKMKRTHWVHFACHGVQDPINPLNSGLCLADSRLLNLSEIIRLSRRQGGLAFLSACQTAKGDEKLSEEAVHLAAGMLLAGYDGVIATMWSIMDNDAPKVTKAVYEHLFRDGKVPDSTEGAEALHYAVRRLRDSGASPFSWVPFIHVGL